MVGIDETSFGEYYIPALPAGDLQRPRVATSTVTPYPSGTTTSAWRAAIGRRPSSSPPAPRRRTSTSRWLPVAQSKAASLSLSRRRGRRWDRRRSSSTTPPACWSRPEPSRWMRLVHPSTTGLAASRPGSTTSGPGATRFPTNVLHIPPRMTPALRPSGRRAVRQHRVRRRRLPSGVRPADRGVGRTGHAKHRLRPRRGRDHHRIRHHIVQQSRRGVRCARRGCSRGGTNGSDRPSSAFRLGRTTCAGRAMGRAPSSSTTSSTIALPVRLRQARLSSCRLDRSVPASTSPSCRAVRSPERSGTPGRRHRSATSSSRSMPPMAD